MMSASEQAAPQGEAEDEPVQPSASYAHRQNVIAPLVPLAIGVVTAILSWRLGIGSLADPGPGLWPLVVSVTMVVVAAVLVVQSRPTGDEEKFTRESLLVVVGVVSLIGYALLFERIGFEIPTVALLVLWLKVLGRESWRITIAVSLVSTTAVYLLFITGLGVSLPHIVHL